MNKSLIKSMLNYSSNIELSCNDIISIGFIHNKIKHTNIYSIDLGYCRLETNDFYRYRYSILSCDKIITIDNKSKQLYESKLKKDLFIKE